jgi:pyruvate dehydrogenase E2 component (dihydrolipoamide acetyltransferase)
MSFAITMPKLGFDMQEGRLVKWLKEKGDPVKSGEPVVEIETDKATIEVESFGDGILTHVFAEPGQMIPVGKVIGLLDGENQEGSDNSSTTHMVIDNTPSRAGVTEQSTTTSHVIGQNSDTKKISPLARRIAREKNFDYSILSGTGPGGMIIKRDLQILEAVPNVPPTKEKSPGTQPNEDILPLSRIRQTIARRMVQSATEIPQFTVSISIEMDKVLDLRSRFNNVFTEYPLSINDLIVKAVSISLRDFPNLNSSFYEGGIILHSQINIGMAVALPEGLITVVVRDADQKSLRQISMETDELIKRAREGKMHTGDIEGSTFTISNLGMYGIDSFTALINPPEAAILAVAAVQVQPIFENNGWQPRSMAKFSLTIDHRISDGAEAASFLQEIKNKLEEPISLI